MSGGRAPPGGGPSLPEARVPPTPGRPFPLALLGWAPSNITFTLLFGRRFDYQDPVFVSLLRLIDDVMVLLGTPSLQVRGGCSRPRLGVRELSISSLDVGLDVPLSPSPSGQGRSTQYRSSTAPQKSRELALWFSRLPGAWALHSFPKRETFTVAAISALGAKRTHLGVGHRFRRMPQRQVSSSQSLMDPRPRARGRG